jgi:two-component system, OmpR family, sensor histidine kinase KdpD
MTHIQASNSFSTARTWGSVLALLVVATLAGAALDQHVSLTSQSMFYVLAVVVAATTLTTLASVVCALGAVIAFNFFFVPPRWTFEVESQEHLIALGTMLVVALAISHLTAKLRNKTEVAKRNALRAHQLQALASALASATTAQEVVTLGVESLDVAFQGPNTLALLDDAKALASSSERFAALQDGLASCLREAATLGPGTGRWPGLNAWYIPLASVDHQQGAVCVENVQAADEAGREHAQALCLLLAQALVRLKMAAAIQASHLEAQRQQVQSTFLAAISHDLRTPLAAVVGAASALQSQGEKLTLEERQRLLGSIVTEAHYLSNLTENTLQLVQLTNAALPMHRGWESMEEIAGAVLGRMRLRDTQQRINAKIPKNLPLIEVDPVLIAQLIGNLLDNALKYSQGPVDLVVRTTEQHMVVMVKDRGTTIAESLHEGIFQPYARSDRSGQRGAGLGLALCRAIAQVHGATIAVKARQGGGNSFNFYLALNPVQPALGTELATEGAAPGEAP